VASGKRADLTDLTDPTDQSDLTACRQQRFQKNNCQTLKSPPGILILKV
jgi:hypothetical protein